MPGRNFRRARWQPSHARVDRQAHVPPAHGLLGLCELFERPAAEIHAGVACRGHEQSRFALDHERRRFLRIGCEHDVDLRDAPGLAGLEADLDRQLRNTVDDVLRRRGFEVVDADAHVAIPASEAAPGRLSRPARGSLGCGCEDRIRCPRVAARARRLRRPVATRRPCEPLLAVTNPVPPPMQRPRQPPPAPNQKRRETFCVGSSVGTSA